MKRILFACLLLVAIGNQRAAAQALVHVTAAEFTVKVNLLDSYIGAGNMTAATATWDTVHHMMLNILSYTKKSIHDAATPTESASYTAVMTNQRNIYQVIWPLHTNLATNRSALHTKLGEFDATIY